MVGMQGIVGEQGIVKVTRIAAETGGLGERMKLWKRGVIMGEQDWRREGGLWEKELWSGREQNEIVGEEDRLQEKGGNVERIEACGKEWNCGEREG